MLIADPPVVGIRLPPHGVLSDLEAVAWLVGAAGGALALLGLFALVWLLGRGLSRLLEKWLDRGEAMAMYRDYQASFAYEAELTKEWRESL